MSECAICVAVRVRPLDKDDDPLPIDVMMTFEENSINLQNKMYTFDHVFPPGAPNKYVYDTAVAEKISHIFEGCNVTILAYGSTGSGKTFTMGTNYDASKIEAEIGIIPLCIKELFEVMESHKNSKTFSVKISFLELYREEIYDLLQKPPVQCALREDMDGVKVSNLTEILVKSAEDAFIELKKGCIARRTCATAKNSSSSRSHGIFSVYIEQTDKANLGFKRSKFQLVDLAGSERVGSSKTTGVQIKEGININLGLLTLRTVISKLAEDKKQHVPYRNSKLTRLLQDSLGGNSHTLMIACVGSSHQALDETLSTLRYASCARSIKNQPHVNTDPPAVQIEKLKKQVQELQLALARGEKVPDDQTVLANIVEGSERYEELHRELQKSYEKSRLLRQQSAKCLEKNQKAVDCFRAINEKIKLLIAELTAEIAAVITDKDNFLLQTLKNLEEIHHDLQQSVSAEPDKYFDTEPQESEKRTTSSVEEKSSFESDLEPQLSLDDISDPDMSTKLCDISERITLKTGLVKSLEDYFQTVENVDQDYVSSLVEKINTLVKEKEALQESKKTAERMEKSKLEKIAKYELEIKDLQKEVRAKKIVLKTKEENQRKIMLLQTEIQEMKKIKVDLVKQVKEGGNKFVRLQREKDKELAKLVKDSRKKEIAYSKMVNKLENQVNVYKKRLDIVTLEKKPLVKASEQKKLKSSQQSNLETIEKRIDHVLDVIEETKIHEVHHKDAEEEYIPDFQEYQIDARQKLSKEQEESFIEKIESAKSFIKSSIEKKKQLQGAQIQQSNENDTIQNFINTLGTVRETKVGIQHMFNQYRAAVEKYEKDSIVKRIELYKEHQEEIGNFKEKIDQYEEVQAELEIKIKSMKTEHEIQELELKRENEKLKKVLVEEVHDLVLKQQNINLHSDLTLDTELQNKVKLQDEQIQILTRLVEDYKTKSLEIQTLSQQVLNAKKGKRVNWLGDITNRPSPSDVDDDKPISLLDEYLNDSAEESFNNDMKDPDWRATPLYKQRQKSSRKISPNVSDDIDCPPAKKSPLNCHCVGECKSKRCRCRKNSVDCTAACFCNKKTCLNFPKTIALSSEK